MGFIILIFIIVPLILLIKKGSPAVKQYKNLIVYIIKVIVGMFIIGIPLELFKASPDTNSTIFKLYLIGAAAFFVIRILTYKTRVNRYISEYLVGVVADNSRTNQLTEASFFSQPKTKVLLDERVKVGGQTSYQFMQNCLRENVLSAFKYNFQRELYDGGNEAKDRVFFRYEFHNYDLYLEEQGMDFIDTLESFNIVKSGFLYVENEALFSAAFFSKEIFERMKAEFVPFLAKDPKLSDVPFTLDFLWRTMYQQETLNAYIEKDALDMLASDKDLFEEEFVNLYSGVAMEEINNSVDSGRLNVIPNPNDNNKQAYLLNHADENGIIKEEFGMSAEKHRVTLDLDLDSNQLDDLEGCPA